jgi:hypothetical protein
VRCGDNAATQIATMVPIEQRSICGYYRSKRKEKKQRQASGEAPGQTKKHARLSKPPKVVASSHPRPRNRLQKRVAMSSRRQDVPSLYLLEYEQYPYQTRPSEFLGVYSSVNSVTAGAFKNGAYTFSREGLLDGSEYLSPTGRIKIHSQEVQQHGLEAVTPDEEKASSKDESVRFDIPHPDNQGAVCEKTSSKTESKEKVFLAIQQTPDAAFCIGVYSKKSLAWGACLKSRAAYALSGRRLSEESQMTDTHGMPQVKARLEKSGLHTWFVKSHEIDG